MLEGCFTIKPNPEAQQQEQLVKREWHPQLLQPRQQQMA